MGYQKVEVSGVLENKPTRYYYNFTPLSQN